MRSVGSTDSQATVNTVDLPIRPAKPKPVDRSTAVGLDLGIKNFLITSDGEVFENQKYLTRNLKRLRVEQRSLDRKKVVKGANYQKQKLIVAKLHEKIANQRKDFLQQLSTELVNQYDTICMEDLHVKGMVRNHCLARSISEQGWSMFKTLPESTAGVTAKKSSSCGFSSARNWLRQ
ncbi:MAG: RNA-guided endonuclease InsQ/TnpB family protein [Cyclobacteriaceae bacterium]